MTLIAQVKNFKTRSQKAIKLCSNVADCEARDCLVVFNGFSRLFRRLGRRIRWERLVESYLA